MAPRSPLCLPALLVVGGALAACADVPGGIAASLEAPQVHMSASNSWWELRFLARAHTSAPLAGAEVRALASCDQEAAGQVRVMLARDALPDDHGRGESVLPLGEGAEVTVPRLAFEGCSGTCTEEFVVVFSAEGIPDGVRVQLPVSLQAELLYDDTAPEDDALTLELVEGP